MSSKIKLGDVFEINTSKGKGYLHYIGDSYILGFGEYIRVLNGLYKEIPDNLSEVIEEKERYIILFSCKTALRRKEIKWVGNYATSDFTIPTETKVKETLKGEFLGWSIIDPKTLQHKFVKTLTNEQKLINPAGLWNFALLKERLEANWSLEVWSNG